MNVNVWMCESVNEREIERDVCVCDQTMINISR